MKIFWILLILVGMLLWYIPNTISLFSGQHSYYNIDPNGSQVPCKKCHGDIDIEIHTSYIHSNFTCSDCHRSQEGVQYASGDDAYERIIYVNVTNATSIYNRVLATTIENYQSGNFPKSILGEVSIDQWSSQYDGNMTFGETGVLYNYEYAEYVSTWYNGMPRDPDPNTSRGGFYARNIIANPDRFGSDNLNGAGSKVTTPGTLAHAASTVFCKDCHSEFLNNTPDVVHDAFINYGITQNDNKNCIACHTATAISINWTKPAAMNINTMSNGYNTIIIGTGVAYRQRVETFGNQSGDVIAVSNVTVI